MMNADSWDSLVHNKRAALFSSIPQEWRLPDVPSPDRCLNVIDWPRIVLSSEEVLITEAPPLVILTNIHALVWRSEDVTRAFCHRAAVAHQLTNCLTEVMFGTAIETAKELDQYQRDGHGLKGPLHGLPLSFMDRFRIAGVETSSGFVAWLGHKELPQDEGPLVRYVRSLGAIPICKTNVPQSLMLGNTSNNIFGSTLNPYNRKLSAGGAAGGEGALLAMRGSPFGWATEIAGSTRIPAAFNNLFALRVTSGRLSALGLASSSPNLPLCSTTIGMISHSLSFLQYMCRLTLGSEMYQEDPAWLDVPWRELRFQTFKARKPVFAVLLDDQHVRPQPPIRRVLRQITDGLRARGYEVIDWRPPSHKTGADTLFKIIGADGASDIRANINKSGEPPVQQLRTWFFEQHDAPMLSVSEFWSLCKSRTDFMTAYNTYWLSSAPTTTAHRPVDGVIMPVAAQVACQENELDYFAYSAVVNYLDFSSITVPISFVNRDVDIHDTNRAMLNAKDAQIQTNYNPSTFHGMPVGIQIMCRRAEEEVALSLAEIVSEHCSEGKKLPPPLMVI